MSVMNSTPTISPEWIKENSKTLQDLNSESVTIIDYSHINIFKDDSFISSSVLLHVIILFYKAFSKHFYELIKKKKTFLWRKIMSTNTQM